MPRDFQIIDHTADVGVRVFGSDPQTLFSNAARAMLSIITDLRSVRGGQSFEVRVEGADWEDLMVNWLREILYLWAGKEIIAATAIVKQITDTALVADVDAEAFDPERHRIHTEIKAVTYHRIGVHHGLTGWTAEIIFDV